MSTAPICNAQQPSPFPSSFDWWPFVAAGVVGTGAALAYAIGKALIPYLFGPLTFTAAAAGAAAIFTLVLYYVLKPDGCIRPPPKPSEPICLSGIVQDTVDQSSTAVAILAPFAMGPAGMFDVVVKSIYWHYVVQNSYWVYCDDKGAAMLPCIIKSKTACGAKIGSLVGAVAGAVAGTILGYLAGAALAGALACGAFTILAWLCLLLVLLVAAIVAAIVTYAASTVGGWIGEAITSAGSDPVGDAWKGLEAGAIVTVKGNWVTDPDIGNNELLYTTDINRTGKFKTGPSYTTADADSTAHDDCPIVLPAPS
jgi:hypothetical protein